MSFRSLGCNFLDVVRYRHCRRLKEGFWASNFDPRSHRWEPRWEWMTSEAWRWGTGHRTRPRGLSLPHCWCTSQSPPSWGPTCPHIFCRWLRVPSCSPSCKLYRAKALWHIWRHSCGPCCPDTRLRRADTGTRTRHSPFGNELFRKACSLCPWSPTLSPMLVGVASIWSADCPDKAPHKILSRSPSAPLLILSWNEYCRKNRVSTG